MTVVQPSARRDQRLEYELVRSRRALQSAELNRRALWCWGLGLATLLLLVLAAIYIPALDGWMRPLALGIVVTTAGAAAFAAARTRVDRQRVIAAVVQSFPEVEPALRTAAAQVPDAEGRFHFLQRRVIHEALAHAADHDWAVPFRSRARNYFWGHATAALAALAVGVWVSTQPRSGPSATSRLAHALEVTPGTVEIERGSTLWVGGRFDTAPSGEVTMVWQPASGSTERRTMVRSVADPVYAASLANVSQDGQYHLEYDGGSSEAYRVSVYDRPALLRADARLTYPAFTGRAPREVADTRRVSGVVGTDLEYTFSVNKPLERAELIRPDGTRLPLEALTPTRYRWRTQLAATERLRLHLEDSAGRTPVSPVELFLDALPNRRPELTLRFPRGDVRVSPIEELALEAEARDDYGLQDAGLAFAIGDGEPEFVSLWAATSTSFEAALAHRLALENQNVRPNQVVTWFAWADDIGNDGQVRRTTSDLAFAEIRPFEEIFREDATGGGAAGGGGGEGADLIETQRQLSIAIWRLRERDRTAPDFDSDRLTLRDSQDAARRQLEELRADLEEADARTAAEEADQLMSESAEKLSATELDRAWRAAQGAYQRLLQLQPPETNVAQSPGGQGSGRQRNSRQLNELDFRHEADRYATETQAQPPPTPQEREQLELLARLRELARRQQQVNDRLQELQAALAAAQDEQEREQIRRELKRLADEQRQMLADLDDARQRSERMSPGERSEQTRAQLDQTRTDMQRASEQLEQNQVSQALAAGARAQEQLQQGAEQLRSRSSGRFNQQMRDAREQARELAQEQRAIQEELDQLGGGAQQLDDSSERHELAAAMEAQQERRRELLDRLREVAQESEAAEPQLHRQLYDLVRREEQPRTNEELERSAQMLRRGFVEPVREAQAGLADRFEQLQHQVERAAASVLGDETNELRFAQQELAELGQALRGEQPQERGESGQTGQPEQSGRNSSSPGEVAGDGERSQTGEGPSPDADARALEQLAQQLRGESGQPGEGGEGPLTGRDFGGWAERLRTVESLVEDSSLRQQLSQARFEAEEMRREFLRHGHRPQWELVEAAIGEPLNAAQRWLQQELSRRTQPDALQPIDRDPVPERYAEAVQRYYEALGEN